jgi:murein L,D-transpeptidase YcbB/YkuD
MLRAIEVMQRIKKGQMGSRGVPKQTPARQFYSLAVLNVSVAARIRQIEVNLERWRWLPPDLEQRTLLVNLANFSLEVVENGKPLLPRRIVVGKRSWDTWVFSASVTTLILNEDCA